MKVEYVALVGTVALGGALAFGAWGLGMERAIVGDASGRATGAHAAPGPSQRTDGAAPRASTPDAASSAGAPGPARQAASAGVMVRFLEALGEAGAVRSGAAAIHAAQVDEVRRLRAVADTLPEEVRAERFAVGQFVHAHSGNGSAGVRANVAALSPRAGDVFLLLVRGEKLPSGTDFAQLYRTYEKVSWNDTAKSLRAERPAKRRWFSRAPVDPAKDRALRLARASLSDDGHAYARVVTELQRQLGAARFSEELGNPGSVTRQLLRDAVVQDRGWPGILLAPRGTADSTRRALEAFFPGAPAEAVDAAARVITDHSGIRERFSTRPAARSEADALLGDQRISEVLAELRQVSRARR